MDPRVQGLPGSGGSLGLLDLPGTVDPRLQSVGPGSSGRQLQWVNPGSGGSRVAPVGGSWARWVPVAPVDPDPGGSRLRSVGLGWLR